MPAFARVRAGLAKRGWPIAAVPTPTVLYFGFVEVLALGITIQAFVRSGAGFDQWGKALLLIGLAIAFEEWATRAARLRLRLADGPRQELDSVWVFAAVLAVPPALVATVVGAVLLYEWWRQQRPAGKELYRMLFNMANAFITCLAAAYAFRWVTTATTTLPAKLGDVLPLLVAIVVSATINRLLVIGVLISMRVQGLGLGIDREEVWFELAAYSLGALVALAVNVEPWMAILVLAPLAALDRGVLLRQFETAATKDSKTGLLNAIAWEQIAEREVSRAGRNSTSLTVIIVDIDRFKLVNDKFGHLSGDKVLKEIGHCLSAELREYDTVGRFGGEEFVAILPDANELDALVAAERLRSRINQLDIAALLDEPCDPYELSVSIGVAVYGQHGTELAELLREADAALYRAKSAGRNRVMLADRGRGTQKTPAPEPVYQT